MVKLVHHLVVSPRVQSDQPRDSYYNVHTHLSRLKRVRAADGSSLSIRILYLQHFGCILYCQISVDILHGLDWQGLTFLRIFNRNVYCLPYEFVYRVAYGIG